MNQILENTSKSEQKIASSFIELLSKGEEAILDKRKKIVELKIQGMDEVIAIPLKAFSLLKSILSNMAEGKSIAILLADSEMTTQEAADVLGVSRPHLVKLLENGEMPFKKVGSHRRVLLRDLLEYEEKIKKERKKNLEILAEEAQKNNLGYKK